MLQKALRLGLLADDSAGLGELLSQLQSTQHHIICSVLMRSHSLPLREDVDAWIVSVADPDGEVGQVLESLHDNDVPYLLMEAGSIRARLKNLLSKIYEAVASPHHGVRAKSRPRKVWVLAASAGGPESVLKFFECLQDKAGHDAFIYAQHLDSEALPTLFDVASKTTSMAVSHCISGAFVEAGKVYIVDPEQAFEITENGRIVATQQAWSGAYKPSLNQVIARVGRVFRQRSGAIVFSGMGDDGAGACRMMHAYGGTVLIQTFDSCAVDSMPRSVKRYVAETASATVEELAKKVAEIGLESEV